ncbi:MAG: hypothetical protein WD934_09645 [Gemmatimonadales bacterium]
MKRILVGGCAALLVTAACSDDPSLYLGGPAGPAARIQLSSTSLEMTVGDAATVGAVALDAVGNVTSDAPAFAACSGSPVTVASATPGGLFSSAATIQAAASAVGDGCVLVTAAGLTDSVRLRVGPAGITITGPATVGSGEAGTFAANGFDAAGAAVTGTPSLEWTSSNKALLVTELTEGITSGRTPGAVSLRVRAAGGANATLPVTVTPGAFTGTTSATTGAPGLVITATRGPGDDEFDANSAATYGGQTAWVELASPTSMRVALPATGSATAQNLLFTGLGPNQTAKQVTFTSTSAFDDRYGNASDLPVGSPGYVASRSPDNWLYFTHSGFGTGTANRGIWNGGTQQDHYFQFTTGATAGTVVMTLQWTNFGPGAAGAACAVTVCSDFDLEICTIAGTGCQASFSGINSQEVTPARAVAANTTYTVMASAWTGFNNIHNFRVRVAPTGTTIN